MGQACTRVCASAFTLLCAYYIKGARELGGTGQDKGLRFRVYLIVCLLHKAREVAGVQGARWDKEL